MNLAEDMWLRGKAAQRSLLELTAFNAAFLSNATVQAVELGLSAPITFWSAMGRAGGASGVLRVDAANVAEDVAADPVQTPEPAALPITAEVVQLHPDPAPQPMADVVPDPVPTQVADAGSACVAEVAAASSPLLLDEPRGGLPDDLTTLKGVGSKLAKALNEFGIYHFDQIATLDAAGIDWLNEQQPGFKMTCARYDLVAQAEQRLS